MKRKHLAHTHDEKQKKRTKSSFRFLFSDKKNLPEIERLLASTPNIPLPVDYRRQGMTFEWEGKEYVFAPQEYGVLTIPESPHEKRLALYVEDQNRIVAFLTATMNEVRKVARIDIVSVNPYYAGQGLCQTMVNQVAAYFHEIGIQKVTIDNAGGLPACICYHKAMQPYYPNMKYHPRQPIIALRSDSHFSEMCKDHLDRMYEYTSL